MRYEEIAITSGESLPLPIARRAVRALRADGVVVHPTSTLYGIGARMTPAGDGVLARLKGRVEGKGFVRLAATTAAARAAAATGAWGERAERLSACFWPGPLTLVVDDGTRLGLAVRVDPHPVVLGILTELDELMSSTSVNRAGEPPARDPREVRAVLARMPSAGPAVFLEAGPPPGASPSTLLSLRDGTPRLLRAGGVAVEEIEACLGEEVHR